MDTIHKSLPKDLKRDIYYLIIEASWIPLIIVLFIIYLITNTGVALLYLAVPDSIANAAPGSFLDAFFFSVQTISTIGFGQLYPANLWANIIVTIEANTGLIGMALVTGIVFAKFSKPRAKIVFSKPIIMSKFDGQDRLAFRIGNGRGNDIVEGKISVALLIDTITREGAHMRQTIDLPLVRQHT